MKTECPPIVGVPNVRKSTLLNTLLCEEKALVSDIAGTTRDMIEDTLNIDGVTFRFIDTAGIRRTDDPLEGLGIERTFDRIGRALTILLLTDARQRGRYCAVRFALFQGGAAYRTDFE
ncbi:MAG: GTPase [Alistipes sp.]